MGDRGGLLSQIQAGKKLKSAGPPPSSPPLGRVSGGGGGPPSRGGPSRPGAPTRPTSPSMPALPSGPSAPSRGSAKPLPSLPSPTKPLPPSPMSPPAGLISPPPGPSRPSGRPASPSIPPAEEEFSPPPSRGPPMRGPPPRVQAEESHPPPMRPPGRPSSDEKMSPSAPPSRPRILSSPTEELSAPPPMRLPSGPGPSSSSPRFQVEVPRDQPAKILTPATVGKEFEERLKYNFPAAEMQVEAGLYVVRRFASYISKLCKAMQVYYGSVDEATKKEVGLGVEFQKDGMTDHVSTIFAFETIMTENSRKMHNFATAIVADVVMPLQSCHTNSVAQLKGLSDQFQNLYKPFLPLQRQQRRCVEVSAEMDQAKTEALRVSLKTKLDAETAKYESMKSALAGQASSFHNSTLPLLISLQQLEQNRLFVLQQALTKLSEQCTAMEQLTGVGAFRDTVAQLSEAKAIDAWTSGVTKVLDQNFVSQNNPSGPPVPDWPVTDGNSTYRLSHRATISAGASMRQLWGTMKSGVVDAVESVKSSKGASGDAPGAPTPPGEDPSPSSPKGTSRVPSAPAAPEAPSAPPLSGPGAPSAPPFLSGPGGPPSRGPAGLPSRGGPPPKKPSAPIVIGQYDYPGTGDESYDLLFSEGARIELLAPSSVDWDAVAAGEVVWCTGRLIPSGEEGGFPASFVAPE